MGWVMKAKRNVQQQHPVTSTVIHEKKWMLLQITMGNFSFFSNFSRTLPWLVFILGNKNLLLYFLFIYFCLCMEYILCLDRNILLKYPSNQAIRIF